MVQVFFFHFMLMNIPSHFRWCSKKTIVWKREVTVTEGDQDEEDDDEDNDEEEEEDDADAEADEYLNKFINKGGEVS